MMELNRKDKMKVGEEKRRRRERDIIYRTRPKVHDRVINILETCGVFELPNSSGHFTERWREKEKERKRD